MNTTTTMNTGAASLSDEQRTKFNAWLEKRGVWPRLTYFEIWQAALAASTPQADAAPIIDGHAVNDLFLKWSEWTTELGEAISRKNIDGFVSELRAAIAAGGAQEPSVEQDERGAFCQFVESKGPTWWANITPQQAAEIAWFARTVSTSANVASKPTEIADCPHAAPHRYCYQCVVSPCPIGLGEKK